MATKKKASKGLSGLVIAGIAGGSVVGVFLLLLIIAPQPSYKTGFRTITEMETYSKGLDEWIKAEGKNILKPDYDTYYKKHFSPSFSKKLSGKFAWLLGLIGLKSDPIFSASFFKQILEDVTKDREKRGWKGKFIQKAALSKDSKIAAFGAIQGAYHSILRYLQKLQELGMIDNDFKLKNPDYYFIFIGNVVNRSPWSLEIFSIMLRLLQQNPDNVIFQRGLNEYNKFWSQHTLKRELELRAQHLSSSKIPLEKEVDAFFETMPLSTYFTMPFEKKDKLPYMRATPLIRDKEILATIDDKSYAKFIADKNEKKLDVFDLAKRKAEGQTEIDKIQVKGIIKGIRKRDLYEKMDGLRLLEPIDGITAWTLLSTPAEPYRKGLKFYNDAFTVITPAAKIDDWKITLYYRDVRKKEDKAFKTRWHYFFSGKTEGDSAESTTAKSSKKEEVAEKKPVAKDEKKKEDSKKEGDKKEVGKKEGADKEKKKETKTEETET